MSVYTELTLADIRPFLAEYALPDAVALDPIRGGIENSNYFLRLGDGRELVLTLFEELDAGEAAFIGPLLERLAQAGVPVAAPLRNASGVWLGRLAGKPAQLAPRLPGSHPEQPDLPQCRAMGATLARLHAALRDYPLQRSNAHGTTWWEAVAARWRPRLPAADRELLDRTLQRHAQTCAACPDLQCGLIHGDLFRDNTLFTGDTISAVLDFSECSRDHLLLDIAITVNDFCRQWPEDLPDAARRTAFIAGYESVRALTPGEKSALPDFLAVAAMRFWLSRLDIGLRNREENRGGEHVLEKDPEEMRALLQRLLAEA